MPLSVPSVVRRMATRGGGALRRVLRARTFTPDALGITRAGWPRLMM